MSFEHFITSIKFSFSFIVRRWCCQYWLKMVFYIIGLVFNERVLTCRVIDTSVDIEEIERVLYPAIHQTAADADAKADQAANGLVAFDYAIKYKKIIRFHYAAVV